MKSPPIALNQAVFGEIAIKPHSAPFAKTVSVTTTQNYGRGGENARQWQLSMTITFKHGDAEVAPSQYEGHVEVTGIFTVLEEMTEEKMLHTVAVTCPSMLYGTAREMVATLTARSTNGVFLLPTVSFADGTLAEQKTPAIEAKAKGK